MGIIAILGLIYMIYRTLKSLTDKKLMDEHNKDGMFGGWLILALIAEIIGLIWMIQGLLK